MGLALAAPVAVTGIGLVTPGGVGTEASWSRVLAADPTSGHDELLAGNPIDLSCRVPSFDPAALLGGATARRVDRFVQFALVAGREAVADAGLDPLSWDGARVGVVLGCADGGPGTVEQEHRVLLRDGPGVVSPHLLPKQLPNMLAGWVSTDQRATGPSLVVATACASGSTAIGLARDLLLLDRCDVVLAGGSEAMITPLVMAGFARMKALATGMQDPKSACRPFDVTRDGFVAGEGAGLMVLERVADATARGARVRAHIRGFGASADAHHMTAPHPDGRGIEAAVRAALAEADLGGTEVDHVNTHGTATPRGDLAEAAALSRLLGDGPLISSTKGVTGHMFGAAGGAEAVFAVLATENGVVPGTAGLREVDPLIHLEVATRSQARRCDVVLSTSMGFGGQNAALVVTAA